MRIEKAAEKVAACILYVQGKFAAVMGRWLGNMAGEKMRILLVAFCLLGTFLSIYLVYGAFIKVDPKKKPVEIHSIHMPQHITNVDPGGSKRRVEALKHLGCNGSRGGCLHHPYIRGLS